MSRLLRWVLAVGVSVVIAVSAIGVLTASQRSSTPASDSVTSSNARAGDQQDLENLARVDAESQIRDLLGDRSEAVQRKDRRAFLATVDRSRTKLVKAQRTMYANLRTLPLTVFSYRTSGDFFEIDDEDVTNRRARATVIEDVQFEGADRAPVSNLLEMTFVERDGAWLVASPGKSTAKLSAPQSRPWEGGPVDFEQRDDLVVVVDQDASATAASLADSIQSQVASNADLLNIKPRFNLVVDATSSGRGVRFAAEKREFASAVSFEGYYFSDDGDREAGSVGNRIKYNPKQTSELIADRGLLRHELTHFLTAGNLRAEPTWVSEGLAEYVGYYPSRPSGLVIDSEVFERVNGKPRILPTSLKFGLDPSADYLLSYCAATYLIDTYGMDKFTKFRRSFDAEGESPDAQVGQRLRRVFGINKSELADQTWETFNTFNQR